MLVHMPSSGWNSVRSPVTPTPCSFAVSQSCLGFAALTLNPRGRGGFLDLGQDVWTTMVLHRRSNAIIDTVHLAQCWQDTLRAQQGLVTGIVITDLSLPKCHLSQVGPTGALSYLGFKVTSVLSAS